MSGALLATAADKYGFAVVIDGKLHGLEADDSGKLVPKQGSVFANMAKAALDQEKAEQEQREAISQRTAEIRQANPQKANKVTVNEERASGDNENMVTGARGVSRDKLNLGGGSSLLGG